MPKRKQTDAGEAAISLRLNPQLLARADALVPWLTNADEGATAAGAVTRSDVVRVALNEGLKALEKRARVAQ